MKFKVFFFAIFSHASFFLNAQTCCSGGIPLSNNIGLAVSEKGTTQIGLNYDYNNLNTLNNGTTTLDDNARLRITHSVLFNIGYTITNRFAVEGLFTWVNQRRKISQFENENLDQTSGVGDAIILLKYNFPNAIGKNSAINVGIGTKLPLGSTTETNDQGIIFAADLQPGSNAWDIIFWSLFFKSFNFRPSFNISSRITYRGTGTNNSYLEDLTYQFGNEFQTYLGFSDEFLLLNTLSSPSISFKYRNAGQDKIDGFDLDNTGGNWISIIPKFSINITPKITFSASAELPIYSNVDGTQLTPTYRLTTGLLFKIIPKSNIIDLN